MPRGQQAVTAQQPRRRRHPRGQHRAADDGQDRLGVPGEGGRRDRARYHRDQERHPAHHDQRRGGDGQDPPDQGVHRHPEQVAPGRRVAEQPAQARGVGQLACRSAGGGWYDSAMGTPHHSPASRRVSPASPAQGQQHGGHEEPADGEPGAEHGTRSSRIRWSAVPRARPGRSEPAREPGTPIPAGPAPARPRPASARRSPGRSTRRPGTTRGRAGACCARAGCQ